MTRTILIHCHMFKNAGTTFDWSLQRNFGELFLDHRDDEPMRNQKGYLYDYLQKHKDIVSLSSHHIQLPLPVVEDINFLPAFLLRHPIDRVGSVYEFERQQDADTPGAINAKKLSFNEYIAWRMQLNVGATIRNYQVRYCAGAFNKVSLDNNEFTTACQTLNRSPLLGLVEKYDESMVLFEEVLRRYFNDIDLAYVPQNTGKRRRLGIDKRIEAVLSNLDAPIKESLLSQNKLDIELYTHAEKLLNDRISLIADFDMKLADFRQRCSNLSNKVKHSTVHG